MPDIISQIQLGAGLLLAFVTAVYVAGILWFMGGLRRSATTSDATPLVTVVVAARNEENNIDDCLDGLLNQDYPDAAYEIVVVNDGSTDATAARVADRVVALGANVPSLRLVDVPECVDDSVGKKAALTLGIECGEGEIILTTDVDCRVPRTWIRGMVKAFEPDVGLVVGFAQIGQAGRVRGFRAGWEALDFLGLMACAFGAVGRCRAFSASGQNLAYRRRAFQQVGGFESVRHHVSGDDMLLVQLIRRLTKWRIVAAPPALTSTRHPQSDSWRSLLHQRLRWSSNAPFLKGIDRPIFSYLVCAFIMEVMLISSLFAMPLGMVSLSLGLGSWLAKSGAELVIMVRAAFYFGRCELLYFFPIWTLMHPFAVVILGIGGCRGRFEWKGRFHRGGCRT